MNPEVSLKSPKEMGGGLIIWGLVMGGELRKEEARPESKEAEQEKERP